jgi:transcriptional regulator GlxA family with amidase domain
MRLQRAIELMKQNAGTVAEIAYMTGFNTPNYLAKCFRKQFGCSPSEYKINISQENS